MLSEVTCLEDKDEQSSLESISDTAPSIVESLFVKEVDIDLVSFFD